GFVDLVDLRLRCDKIQVKVASWMKGLSGIPSLRLVYVADDETILPVTEVTYPGGSQMLKMQSDWIDLLEVVPAARTEALGHLSLELKVAISRALVGGSSIILRCVPPTE